LYGRCGVARAMRRCSPAEGPITLEIDPDRPWVLTRWSASKPITAHGEEATPRPGRRRVNRRHGYRHFCSAVTPPPQRRGSAIREIDEGSTRGVQRLELGEHLSPDVGREAGADLTGEAQLAVLVVTDQSVRPPRDRPADTRQ
jgi:hypothetical protein